MKLHTTILAALGTIVIAATGCVGSLESDGPDDNPPGSGADAGTSTTQPDGGPTDTPSTAQAMFEQNVRPVVAATCSPGGACHSAQSPAFVSTDPATSYSTIMSFKDILFSGLQATGSTLLTYGNGSHNGALFGATDVEMISAWLAAEKAAADGGGTTTTSPLAIWSGCMDLGDWDAEGVATAWANKNAQGQGNCEACHNLGGDGFIASDQSERVFNTITTNPAFMLSYFTLDDTGTNVIINRARLENVGTQQSPHEAHGAFDVDGDPMDRLQRFYNKTLQRKQALLCQPPRFPQ